MTKYKNSIGYRRLYISSCATGPHAKPGSNTTEKQSMMACLFLDQDVHELLERAIDKLGFSARAFNRVLKIARTIADLEGVKDIAVRHVSEAIQYRSLDRNGLFM